MQLQTEVLKHVLTPRVCLQNPQIQGVDSREHETYKYYDECSLDENNAVGGDFEDTL